MQGNEKFGKLHAHAHACHALSPQQSQKPGHRLGIGGGAVSSLSTIGPSGAGDGDKTEISGDGGEKSKITGDGDGGRKVRGGS